MNKRESKKRKDYNGSLEKLGLITEEDKETYFKWQRDRNRESDRIRNKNVVDDIKSKLSCIICGESDPRCLDFHHRDPESKSKSSSGKTLGIANLSTGGYSLKRIFDELAKCDPICANCHRKHHG